MSLNWTEIVEKLVIAAGGYTAGAFQGVLGKRRMRRQLYREISRNYHKLDLQINLVTSVPGLSVAAPLRFAEKLDVSLDIWKFYNEEKRRASLFELEEADAIGRIYEKFNRISMEGESGYPHVRAKQALAEIEDRLIDETLSRKVFEKVSSKQTKPFVADLISGKRERYRQHLSPF